MVGYTAVIAGRGNVFSLSSIFSLGAASIMLYMAGLAWNDYFDAAVDARERPDRPIPSGRILPVSALLAGIVLALAGGLFAGLVSKWSIVVFIMIAGAVITYDFNLKRHPIFGPLNMGLCRALNVLLGASLILPEIFGEVFIGTLLIGAYIASVTLIAREETRYIPNRFVAFLPILICLTGLGLTTVFFTGFNIFFFLSFTPALGVIAFLSGKLFFFKRIEEVPLIIGGFIRALILLQAALLTGFMANGITLPAAALYCCWLASVVLGRSFKSS